METTTRNATKYLESVLDPLIPGGCEVLLDDNTEKGLAYSIVPKVYGDWKFLIGPRGATIGTIRSVMKLWKDRQAPDIVINVYVPDSRYISTE